MSRRADTVRIGGRVYVVWSCDMVVPLVPWVRESALGRVRAGSERSDRSGDEVGFIRLGKRSLATRRSHGRPWGAAQITGFLSCRRIEEVGRGG